MIMWITSGLVVCLALSSSAHNDEYKGHNDGWNKAPEDRFGYVGSLIGNDGTHIGTAFAIDTHIAVSSADIMDAHGRNVTFVLKVPGNPNKDDDKGNAVELKPSEIFIHPYWNGDIEHGYNAAALYFDQPIGVDVPTLADPMLDLEKIDTRLALTSGNATRMAFCNTWALHQCPEINKLVPGSSCAISHLLEWEEDASGGPIIMPDIPACNNSMYSIGCGNDNLDLVVGHMSYMGYSCLNGQVGVVTQTMDIREWLEHIREKAHNRQAADHYYIWTKVVVAVAAIVVGYLWLFALA